MTDAGIQKAMQAGETRFSKAFRESLLAMTLIRAKDYRYINVNEVFERITGWSRSEVLGRTPFDLGILEDAGRRMALVKELLSGRSVQNLEVHARMKNRELRTGLGALALIEINGEACVLSLMADITDLKHDSLLLQEWQERFRELANTVPVMIWMSGTDRLCTYLNHSWLDFTGRTMEQEGGMGWLERVHPEDLHGFLHTYQSAFERRESYQTIVRLLRRDGEYRRLLVSAMPRFEADTSFAGYIGAAIDVESEMARAVFSKVIRRLIQDQEEERVRVARELHNYIEKLALLSIDLDRVGQSPPESVARLRQGIEAARQQIEELVFDIQGLSHLLHSSKLAYLGLEAASASFCKEIARRNQVEVDFAAAGVPEKLPQEISLCLFRALQESLQNAVDYSGSQRLQVSLTGNLHELHLSVRDWGIGFEPQDVGMETGMGLAILQERLKLVGGELSITSEPGKGTRILARVPLDRGPLS